MSLDAMKQALEALEEIADEVFSPYDNKLGEAILALRAAIERAQPDELMIWKSRAMSAERIIEKFMQPEQEPVAYTTGHCENHKQKGGCQLHNLQCGWPDCDRKPISMPPQMQPCAGRNCGSTNPNLHSAECFEDYEKSTGMNQWHGLTNDEIEHIADSEWEEAFVRMIEAKLKEKNS